MNLLLLDQKEDALFLPSTDKRVDHIRKVLKMTVGSQFYVGTVNGPRGKALIIKDDDQGLTVEIIWDVESQKCFPITLIVGLPRPQIARRVLEECTAMGVARILFFGAEKGEESYASSKLWNTDEWRRFLIKGAEQAFSTTIPEILHFESLIKCLAFLKEEESCKIGIKNFQYIALDNYEAQMPLSQAVQNDFAQYIVAIGAERGWSKKERDILRERKFVLAHLGDRVLKVEVACIAAIGFIECSLIEKFFK